MKFSEILLICLSVAFLSLVTARATNLITYPAPKGSGTTVYQNNSNVTGNTVSQVVLSSNYTVTVNGSASPVYFYQSAMTYFDFSGGSVTVQVTVAPSVPVSSVVVRPLRLGITPQVKGQVITFTLANPQNLDVEVNGDTNNPLFIFANPIDTTAPTAGQTSANGTNILYYGPGIYTINGVTLPNNTRVYIAGGAIVYGHFSTNGLTTNSSITGRGIIVADDTMFLNETNLTLEGYIITSNDHSGHWTMRLNNCSNVTINNIKSFPWEDWGQDGLDLCGSQNVTVENSCIRSLDDCIAIKSFNGTNGGNIINHEIYNNVIWGMGQNAFEIGFELNCQLVSDIYYYDNDIIHYSGGKAALGIHDIGWGGTPSTALVKNVLYQNINIEDCSNDVVDVIEAPNLNGADGSIFDITYRNVSLVGGSNPGSTIQIAGNYDRNQNPAESIPGNSYTPQNTAENITFENFQILGQVITNASSGGFNIGGNTSNILFTAAATPASTVPSRSTFNELLSPNGLFALNMQADGNLVEYNGTKPVWASNTWHVGTGPYTAIMQADGNLVIYQANGSATWASGTWGKGVAPYHLNVLNNGSVVVYDSQGTSLFSTAPVANPLQSGGMVAASATSGTTFTQLVSPDGQYELLMQPDGNLVEYSGDIPVWASNTWGVGSGPYRAIMQDDGNLVIYQGNGSPIWASNTWGVGVYPYHLDMQDDGNIVIYDSTGAATYSTGYLY